MGNKPSFQNFTSSPENVATATFAGGCFWCTEAIFKRLRGVLSVIPGYTGGEVSNPTYEEVTTGKTGHAEAIQILFDPEEITYEELLHIFWGTHDPTTKDRQGADVGSQYRSAIFYHSSHQKTSAENIKKQLDEEGLYEHPIVTEISSYHTFYPAEDYHRDFYDKNRDYPYCRIVIHPKLRMLLRDFRQNVKGTNGE